MIARDTEIETVFCCSGEKEKERMGGDKKQTKIEKMKAIVGTVQSERRKMG